MRLIWPTLVGSLFLAVPSALIVYGLMRLLIRRRRAVVTDP
jgi:uncharacterized protein (DUF2062 family)